MSVTGILGKKIGMTQLFDDKGEVHPVTVLQAGPCVVTQLKTLAGDGYSAAQIGLIEFVKGGKVNKPMAGHFAKNNVPPVKLMREVPLELVNSSGGEDAAPALEGGRQSTGGYFRRRQVRRCDRHQQGPWFCRCSSPPSFWRWPEGPRSHVPGARLDRCFLVPFARLSRAAHAGALRSGAGHGAQSAHSRHRPGREPVDGRGRDPRSARWLRDDFQVQGAAA